MPRCRAESSPPWSSSHRRARRRGCSREAHQTGACNQACEGARGAARPGEPVRRRGLRSRLRPDNLSPPPHALAGPCVEREADCRIRLAGRPRAGLSDRHDGLRRGQLAGSTWNGDLVLKGFGDPTLSRGDLRALAGQIRAYGIRQVTGGIEADESYFDSRRVGPAWRSHYYINESPPLSALTVDRARFRGYVTGSPATRLRRSSAWRCGPPASACVAGWSWAPRTRSR
jgi:hypothetical protein